MIVFCHFISIAMGYWHQRLMRGMTTLPQGYQELLVIREVSLG